jgi:hypothetical protein
MNFDTDFLFTWISIPVSITLAILLSSPSCLALIAACLCIESIHCIYNSHLRKVSKDESITTSFNILRDRTEKSLATADEIIQKMQVRLNQIETKTSGLGKDPYGDI